MKILNFLLSAFIILLATFNTANAIDPKKIVGGTVSRKIPTNSYSGKSTYSSKRNASIMSLYRGSKHERHLMHKFVIIEKVQEETQKYLVVDTVPKLEFQVHNRPKVIL